MTGMPWFRVYSEVLNDRKIRKICQITKQPKAKILGVWLTLLAIANESPERGRLLIGEDLPLDLEDLEAETDLPAPELDAILNCFKSMGMLLETGHITKWDDRQYQSDSSADRVARYRDRRRQSGMGANPGYKPSAIHKIYGQCVYCGSDKNLVVDHVFPIQQGGTDDPLNLVSACRQCNSGKAGRTPEEAGYEIIDLIALRRYKEYVTVTGLPSNLIDTESDTDTKTEAEEERAPAAASVERIVFEITSMPSIPPREMERHEQIRSLLDIHPEQEVRAALERSYKRWISTKSKNGTYYKRTNFGWVDWAQEELAGGTLVPVKDPKRMSDDEWREFHFGSQKA